MNRLRMKFVKKTAQTVGLPPGTLVNVSEREISKTKITVYDFDEKHYEKKAVQNVSECFSFKDTPTVTWINVDGLSEIETVRTLGAHFEVHPLVLEDILNTGQRPKMEDHEGYIYFVLKMLFMDEKQENILSEQISIIFNKRTVISFQETEGDIFDPIRDRIEHLKGRVRQNGADYLAYVLLDTIIDHYFIILEKLGDKIEILEEELILYPEPEISQKCHLLKRDLIFLRRHIWPIRELISGLQRNESKLISKSTGVYLKDAYDHTIQIMDSIESLRDVISSMEAISSTIINHRMNEVIKVLTVISTIFMPLTFLVGVYGMNFNYMPELGVKWAYPAVWAVMILIVLVMLAYFKRKKWL